MSSFSRRKYRSVEIAVGPAYWPTFGWTALLAFAQTTRPLLAFRGAVPSLVTIAVVLYAARAGARRGAMLALPAGLLEDVFAGTGGGWTLSTTIVALMIGGVSRRMFADGAFVPAVLCWLARTGARPALLVGDARSKPSHTLRARAPPTARWRAALTALLTFPWPRRPRAGWSPTRPPSSATPDWPPSTARCPTARWPRALGFAGAAGARADRARHAPGAGAARAGRPVRRRRAGQPVPDHPGRGPARADR